MQQKKEEVQGKGSPPV